MHGNYWPVYQVVCFSLLLFFFLPRFSFLSSCFSFFCIFFFFSTFLNPETKSEEELRVSLSLFYFFSLPPSLYVLFHSSVLILNPPLDSSKRNRRGEVPESNGHKLVETRRSRDILNTMMKSQIIHTTKYSRHLRYFSKDKPNNQRLFVEKYYAKTHTGGGRL